jgi:GT2 family glycosyltransferase
VPQVSIITAANVHYGRLSDLRPWFLALCNQTLPPDHYEIIVVDAAHDVDYGTALTRFRAEAEVQANISCHRIERAGRARALNHALDIATGGVIIFLGDDCLPPPQFAESHLHFHAQHPEVEAVGVSSVILPAQYRNPFSVWLEESGQLFGVPFRADMVEIPENFFYVGNASVKRELLERAGRFDERFGHHAFDDLEFGFRLRAAGMRSRFVPGASVIHAHDIDLHGRERSMRESGAAARAYITDHPGNRSWFWLASFPSWFHRLRVACASVYLNAVRTEGALEKWWRARLDSAFAEGYRNGA